MTSITLFVAIIVCIYLSDKRCIDSLRFQRKPWTPTFLYSTSRRARTTVRVKVEASTSVSTTAKDKTLVQNDISEPITRTDLDDSKTSIYSNSTSSSISGSSPTFEASAKKKTMKKQGHPHSVNSRAKISAANKGKQPWNVGRKHSEETKARIAEKTREAMRRKKEAKALELGLTLEEYEKRKEKKKSEKKKKSLKGGLTEEGRKRISESQKKRWQDPEYRLRYTQITKGKRPHSEETKKKLSIAIKAKWQTEEYRSKPRKPPTEEVRIVLFIYFTLFYLRKS